MAAHDVNFSPSSGMGMPDPMPTFAGLVTRIRDNYPDFAYIHVLEATDISTILVRPKASAETRPPVKFLRDIWGNRPYIANANYERDTAIDAVEKEGGLVSFGRHFMSNVGVNNPYCISSKRVLISRFWQPDLPRRLKENIGLTLCNPQTWWTQGAEGYIDYPFATEAA
jgi:NADPH2 dehydrogenase